MAIVGQLSGTVTVGTTSAKEIVVQIDPITEAFTQHNKGRMVVPTSSSWHIIPLGTMTLIALVWLKIVKSSDESISENVQGIRLKQIDATLTVLPAAHALLHICNPKADLDLVQVEIQANADEEIVVEYVLGGT